MPHADTAFVPENITTKEQFWAHVYEQVESLLGGNNHWITNLSNVSSVVSNALLAFPSHFGDGSRMVNWCGFYLIPTLFPPPRLHVLGSGTETDATYASTAPGADNGATKILLGPFCGKPACQLINTTPGKARGVCADAFLSQRTVLVRDVHSYPGHIACDGETQSEIVCPLLLEREGQRIAIGVLDLDCLAPSGFDEVDQAGLEKIAKLVVACGQW